MHVTTIGKLWTYDFPRKEVPAGTPGKVVRYETESSGIKLVHVRCPQGFVVCQATRVEVVR